MKRVYKIIALLILLQHFVVEGWAQSQPDYAEYFPVVIAGTAPCPTAVAMKVTKYSISCSTLSCSVVGAMVKVERTNDPTPCLGDELNIELSATGYYRKFTSNDMSIRVFPPCIFDNSLPAGDYTLKVTYTRSIPLGGSINYPPSYTTFRIENRCSCISLPCSAVNEKCSPGNDGSVNLEINPSASLSPNTYTIVLKNGSTTVNTASTNAIGAFTFPNKVAATYNITVTDTYGNIATCTTTVGLTNNTAINPADINLPPYVCLNTPAFSMINAATTGGTFSIDGVPTNVFNPKVVGAGVKTVTYNNTGRPGCGSINMQTKILVQTPPRYIDRVISATAMPMNDQWPTDYSDVNSSAIVNNLAKSHVFNTGNKGIWRSEESYIYIEDRNQRRPKYDGTNPNVNIRLDGIYDTLPLFLYNIADMTGCFPRWRKTNTITKYNPYSNEIENKDVMNRYSAALYGYKGDLATAVAVNSAETEIAYNGFDEFSAGQALTPELMGPGNLTLFTTNPSSFSNQFSDELLVTVAVDNILTLDASSAKISSLQGKSVKVFGARLDQYDDKQTIIGTFSVSAVDPAKKTITLGSFPLDAKVWKGKISFSNNYQVRRDYSAATVAVVNSSTYPLPKFKSAHTGKNSLAVTGVVESELYKLKVNADRNYVVSAWVLSTNTLDTLTYSSPSGASQQRGIKLKFYDLNGNTITPVTESATIQPSGLIIEGWQRLEGTVDLPAGTARISLVLNDGGSTTLFDDIRFFPETGNIQTYVYNKENYRVSAVLDNNNYATLYYYDEQGNLFLLKKETERGIKTIQESFSHQPE